MKDARPLAEPLSDHNSFRVRRHIRIAQSCGKIPFRELALTVKLSC
jgi:hypothetical protein